MPSLAAGRSNFQMGTLGGVYFAHMRPARDALSASGRHHAVVRITHDILSDAWIHARTRKSDRIEFDKVNEIMTTGEFQREYDFSLVLSGITELSTAVEDSLFEAGCSDATFSVRYGRICAQFSRSAASFKAAIFSAIQDIHNANVGARIHEVEQCNLVTLAEIGRRIGKARQYAHQLSIGTRGPGGFPPPSCRIGEHPFWSWCEVSFWLSENNIIRADQADEAATIFAINSSLERSRLRSAYPNLLEETEKSLLCHS